MNTFTRFLSMLICETIKSDFTSGLPLCGSCYSRIPWIAPQHIRCAVCGRYESCPDCPRRVDNHFISNRSAVRYTNVMKDWLGRLKYRGDERLLKLFVDMLGGVLRRLLVEQQLQAKDVSCITYVPLSSERLQERGFNQAELIACGLASLHHIPVLPLLKRTQHTAKQSYKSRAERLRDLQGVFAIREEKIPHLFTLNKPTIILIDDVYTTGSTMQECARVIQSHSTSRIYSITWAR
jgi:competence protein ComFC